MSKTIDNIQFFKAMCNYKPYSSYAKEFGYTEKDGEATFSKKLDFTKFQTEPQVANEFINDFLNKVTAQHVVDLFENKPLTSTFGRFMRSYGKVGDIEQYITSKLQTVINYDDDTSPTNPYEVNKPDIEQVFITTQDKKLTWVTLNYEQFYGAFITKDGLQRLAGQVLGQLREAIDRTLYYIIIDDLADETKNTVVKNLTTISGVGEEENAKKCYEEIMKLKALMSLPSKTGEYNPLSLENNGTPKDKFVLFLNAKYTASFDINVLAALFNSDKIKLEWELIEFPNNDDVIGVLMDSRAYVFGYRINFTGSKMNPRNMFINTFHHRWIKRGFVSMYNTVLLKETAAPTPEPETPASN